MGPTPTESRRETDKVKRTTSILRHGRAERQEASKTERTVYIADIEIKKQQLLAVETAVQLLAAAETATNLVFSCHFAASNHKNTHMTLAQARPHNACYYSLVPSKTNAIIVTTCN